MMNQFNPDLTGITSPKAENGPQLIAYADRFGGSLRGFTDLLRGPFDRVFTGVHLLPFFQPFDGADAGYDPRDHAEIDPRLGTWNDLERLSESHAVMAEVIVNHMSSDSDQFQDVIARGDASPWSEMFLTMGSVFPEGARESDLANIYRPRPGLPFTAMTLGGKRRLLWTTFTPQQVDLDIRHPGTWDYLTSVIDKLTGAGVDLLRLDAVGYTGKVAGTNCFMTSVSTDFATRIRRYAHQRGAKVLLEIHGHYRQQIEAARTADYVYDFALSPLVLYTLLAHDPEPLQTWLAIRPTNTFTVLDTHDGIGVVDAGRNVLQPSDPGLLDDGQIDSLVEAIHTNSDGASRQATGVAASNLDLYQVNCTYYDALGADDHLYLLARLIQLFVPGTPQVYYVGLLAGRNDVALLRRTGVGRDINRHHYSSAEIDAQLARPVVRAQLAAIRFRGEHPAFRGAFAHRVEDSRLELRWQCGEHTAMLTADVSTGRFLVEATDSNSKSIAFDHRNLAELTY